MNTPSFGIYARISDDDFEMVEENGQLVRQLTGLGVQRQVEEVREMLAQRGYREGGVYIDNDVSAVSKPERRKDYRRLLDDIRTGKLDGIGSVHPYRLVREPRELESLIDLITERSALVEFKHAGMIDLSTPEGRAIARTFGAWGKYEVDLIIQRVSSKHRELAIAGKSHGGITPYGYQRVGKHEFEVVPEQAAVIREGAERILSGKGYRPLVREWKERGIKTREGKDWTPTGLRGLLMSARISGRREYHGTITAEESVFPPIITVEQSNRLRALFKDRSRGREYPRRYLLAGLAICDVCGKALHASGNKERPLMACRTGGHANTITASYLEEYVVGRALRRAQHGALERHLKVVDDAADVEELVRLERELEEQSVEFAEGRLPKVAWNRIRDSFRVQIDDLRRRIDQNRAASKLDGLPKDLAGAWNNPDRMPYHRQRGVLNALIDEVRIHQNGVRGRHGFDTDRVTIKWADDPSPDAG